MGKTSGKFVLLMWKNFTLQKRHPIRTVIEILVPLLLSVMIVGLRGLVSVTYNAGYVYEPFNNSDRYFRYQLAWSPESDLLKGIMADLNESLYSSGAEDSTVKLYPLTDSKALEAFLYSEINKPNHEWGYDHFLAGIQFDDGLADLEELPENVNVTLRFPAEEGPYSWSSNWQTGLLFPVFQESGPRYPGYKEGGDPHYLRRRFSIIQQELSLAIIKHLNGGQNWSGPYIQMRRFPYPKWTEDPMVMLLNIMLAQIIVLSFIYPFINMVKAVTIEKERQLKETMKIMGLSGWLHWTAWFVKTVILWVIPTILLVVLMKVKWYPDSDLTIFTHSNPLIVFLFLFFHLCASITFGFAISSFFTKANTAAVMGGLAWYVSYFPFSFLSQKYQEQNLAEKLGISLLSNSALGYGVQLIMMFEGNEEGIQWHNLWKTASPDDDLVLGHIIIMLVVDTVIYMLIAIYIETVFPGEYGVPLPWYFPFTPSYWCGTKHIDPTTTDETKTGLQYFEPDPTNLEVGVQIKNLRKEFSKDNVAVKNLSLNMYKDQITVLLGHNGAGKTTTMSMLTGMIPPSSGTATVNGYDIRTNIGHVRDSLGLCPQHNILFDDLTVKEHLYFFSRLKGLDKVQLDSEIDKFIQLLELTDKGNAMSVTLSGGMKRKLSVAIALCGDSSVVMCDEPSSGMDPSARRALWDLLQTQKKGRTILLTTHFMDEADLLGDRIAIMAGGELQCCGSSYFLKKSYGAGYRLIMDKSAQCDVHQVTTLLRQYIPEIMVDTDIGSELTYVLNEEKSPVFEQMLTDLENQSSGLGVLSYGVSITNFDEVFMKVNSDHHNSQKFNETGTEKANADAESYVNKDFMYSTGFSRTCNHFQSMFMKRGLSILRSWFMLLLQNCIGIGPLVLALVIAHAIGKLKDLPMLKISLDTYNDPVTILTYEGNTEYASHYKETVGEAAGSLKDWGSSWMIPKIIKETSDNPSAVRTRYIVGATFGENNITAWFNGNPLHAIPLSLQMVTNAILRPTDHALQFYNYPLPFTEMSKSEQQSFGSNTVGTGFQIGFVLSFSMSFVTAFYIIFYIKERVCKAKHLQFVSGVGVIPFWLSSYICDFITYIFTSILIILVLVGFKEEGLTTAQELGRLFSLLVCYGFSAIPFTYLISFVFQTPASGFTKMAFINILSGTTIFLVIHFFKELLKEKDAYDPLHYILLMVPLYSFSTGVRNINDMYAEKLRCGKNLETCLNTNHTFEANDITEECRIAICKLYRCCGIIDQGYYSFSEPGIGSNVLYSCIMGVVFLAVLIGIEFHLFEKLFYLICSRKSLPAAAPPEGEDGDVLNEKQKIHHAVASGHINDFNLVMHDVTKYYKNFRAVNGICLGINQYECFGLLGINGAGKTTTFKMMTGDIMFSSGDAWVNGMNMKTDIKKIHRVIGYCPQFDALLDDLTCRETIIIFSLLRGLPWSQCRAMATKLSYEFDFHQHLHKKVKQLSGGNKRKLSTAIALIGDPQILYLDEPTTGMDPVTKRYLWNELCKIRNKGKCIVLTSHSMEECEALCTRLAIMVNGRFMCLGSTQHLKSKFSEGYTLIIRLRRNDQDFTAVENFVTDHFPGVIIREKHQELVTFYIPNHNQPWSRMFGIMETAKATLNIEDYSLGQSSLEQVFLSFTKYQQPLHNITK